MVQMPVKAILPWKLFYMMKMFIKLIVSGLKK
jgi:hypothetical protein